MTKAELIAKVAEQVGITKSLSEKCVNAIVNNIAEAILKEKRVIIPGLGVFKVKNRVAKKGRNPKTGEEITIPARKVVILSVSKSLKEKVK